jgi:PLP dependent protein
MRFQDLPHRVAEVRARIAAAAQRGGFGQKVTLVGVTKTHGPEAVEAVFEAGVVDIGESKVQEALAKMDAVHLPVRWHLIGHLQRNKAKHVQRFTLLHSLDSRRLADAVSESGAAVDVLVQVNVSGEGTKGGFTLEALREEAEHLRTLGELTVRGVMTMAPLDAGEAELRRVFAAARDAREVLRASGHAAEELSMGMSNDYEIAIEEGATMVRLGTTLFGARET